MALDVVRGRLHAQERFPEDVEYPMPAELERADAGFVEYYNDKCIHKSLGCETPASWC